MNSQAPNLAKLQNTRPRLRDIKCLLQYPAVNRNLHMDTINDDETSVQHMNIPRSKIHHPKQARYS